jgi:galactose mutarotase-like enzyme
VRNWGARWHEVVLAGYPALVLENASLRVTVLVGRGGDVVEFLHKPTDTDFCTFTRRGLPRAEEAQGKPFLDVYYGGWQEVFPSGGAPCRFAGAELDQHAEVALLPWRLASVEERPEAVAATLEVRCLQTPFALRRSLRLDAATPRLDVVSEATHEGAVPFPAMWGQHLAFGPPYLGPGARLELPPGARVVPTEGSEPLEALALAPPRGSRASVTYLTGFAEGRYRVHQPGRPVALEVRWDAALLPYLWCWREPAATPGYPWYGAEYLVGLEPFSSYPTLGLAAAVANGSALTFAPGETRTLRWSAAVVPGEA